MYPRAVGLAVRRAWKDGKTLTLNIDGFYGFKARPGITRPSVFFCKRRPFSSSYTAFYATMDVEKMLTGRLQPVADTPNLICATLGNVAQLLLPFNLFLSPSAALPRQFGFLPLHASAF